MGRPALKMPYHNLLCMFYTAFSHHYCCDISFCFLLLHNFLLVTFKNEPIKWSSSIMRYSYSTVAKQSGCRQYRSSGMRDYFCLVF